MKAHNERCRACKQSVRAMLEALYGHVEANHNLRLPSMLESYRNSGVYEELAVIYEVLQKHRGFEGFVLSPILPNVDYFVPRENMIVEFDESQHFTKPRQLALNHYPRGRQWGFSIKRWSELCERLNKKDDHPPYRDEQRAWYDTLRDFAPAFLNTGYTARLYARDVVWCALNPEDESDQDAFKLKLAFAKMCQA